MATAAGGGGAEVERLLQEYPPVISTSGEIVHAAYRDEWPKVALGLKSVAEVIDEVRAKLSQLPRRVV
jgi:hypothetical protein